MYQIKCDKERFSIIIEPMKCNGGKYIQEGKVSRFNDCIWVSNDRKLLIEYAKKVKETWIIQEKRKLEKLEMMKVCHKYK